MNVRVLSMAYSSNKVLASSLCRSSSDAESRFLTFVGFSIYYQFVLYSLTISSHFYIDLLSLCSRILIDQFSIYSRKIITSPIWWPNYTYRRREIST